METLEFPKHYLAELNAINFNINEDHQDIIECTRLVGFYIGAEIFRLVCEEGLPRHKAHIKAIEVKISSKEVKDDLLFGAYSMYLGSVDDITAYYNEFMATDNTKVNKDKLTKQYKEMLPTSKGQPSPKFVNYENYAGGTTSLDDFKGKYVFIDLWATWCGPCKEEIPHLAKLEKEYHGKNIVFVSISLDELKNKERWRKLVAKKNMGGVQLIADKEFKSDFPAAYGVHGIPRFILLDPNGNIVKSNAPRLSQYEEITKLFNGLPL